MKEKIFIIGGCRSGKSSHGLDLAMNNIKSEKIFIATCTPYDDEMRQRIEKHQAERSKDWITVEEPVDIAKVIRRYKSQPDTLILIDCLTLWITNLILEKDDQDYIQAHVKELASAVQKAENKIILVSNEVGCGIVPENSLARHFRDAAGFANQSIAAVADRVIWMVAGIPVTIKPQNGAIK